MPPKGLTISEERHGSASPGVAVGVVVVGGADEFAARRTAAENSAVVGGAAVAGEAGFVAGTVAAARRHDDVRIGHLAVHMSSPPNTE